MEIPKDILLGVPGYFGLTGVLWAPVWLLLLVCVSHLFLPGLASFNKDSAIWRTKLKQISFKNDWSYHMIWIGLVPLSILLVYVFHGSANTFIKKTLTEYQLDLENFRQENWIPVISLIVTSTIAFLIYRVNRKAYIDGNISTWWIPNPVARRPATVTVAYHVWCALVAATGLVYLIHHVGICVYIGKTLAAQDWEHEVITLIQTPVAPIRATLSSISNYLMYPIFLLVPTMAIGVFEILSRQRELRVEIDTTIIVTVLIMVIGTLLLYVVPALATGLFLKVNSVNSRADVTNPLSIFPPSTLLFFGIILTPAWSTLLRFVFGRLKYASKSQV